MELRERIASFEQWHYEFDLAGHLTPIVEPGHVNRHQQRKAYFFDPLLELYGGSLAGKRVLDIGCNAGFWSLLAIESDADFVLGVDGRRMHLDQASLVFEVNQVDRDRFEFVEANVFESDVFERGPFDVVLCLGLLYHVSKPVTLMELISAANSDVLVVDTCLSRLPGSLFALRHEPLTDPRHAFDYDLVTWPTRTAMLELTRQFGYASTAVLAPRFASWEGCYDFKRRFRRAFLARKQQPLPPTLDTETGDRRAQALDFAAGAWDRTKTALRTQLPR